MRTENKTDFIRGLGRKVAYLRKQKGLNQFEFADKSGKMVNTISKIERGIGDPRISTLIDIAAALDISVLELLDVQTLETAHDKIDNTLILKNILDNVEHCDEKTLQLLAGLIKALTK